MQPVNNPISDSQRQQFCSDLLTHIHAPKAPIDSSGQQALVTQFRQFCEERFSATQAISSSITARMEIQRVWKKVREDIHARHTVCQCELCCSRTSSSPQAQNEIQTIRSDIFARCFKEECKGLPPEVAKLYETLELDPGRFAESQELKVIVHHFPYEQWNAASKIPPSEELLFLFGRHGRYTLLEKLLEVREQIIRTSKGQHAGPHISEAASLAIARVPLITIEMGIINFIKYLDSHPLDESRKKADEIQLSEPLKVFLQELVYSKCEEFLAMGLMLDVQEGRLDEQILEYIHAYVDSRPALKDKTIVYALAQYAIILKAQGKDVESITRILSFLACEENKPYLPRFVKNKEILIVLHSVLERLKAGSGPFLLSPLFHFLSLSGTPAAYCAVVLLCNGRPLPSSLLSEGGVQFAKAFTDAQEKHLIPPSPPFTVSPEIIDLLCDGSSGERFVEQMSLCTQFLKERGVDDIDSGYALLSLMRKENIGCFDSLLKDKDLFSMALPLLIQIGKDRQELGAPSSFSLPSLSKFLELGGSKEEFFSIIKGFGDCPSFLLSKKGVAFIRALDERQKKRLESRHFWIIQMHNLSLHHQKSMQDTLTGEKRIEFEDACFNEVTELLNDDNKFDFRLLCRRLDKDPEQYQHMFSLLYRDDLSPGMVLLDDYKAFQPELTKAQRVHLCRGLHPEELSTSDLYDHEREGCFGQIASLLPLNRLPLEPLIRYLSSMPNANAFSWLGQSILIDGHPTMRKETLTEEQKLVILMRLRCPNSPDPQENWRKFLGVPTEKIAKTLYRSLVPPTPAAEEWNSEMEQIIDCRDPLSLFIAIGSKLIEDIDGDVCLPLDTICRYIVVKILLNAKQHSICGGRPYLNCANGSESTSLCCAPDSVALMARVGNAQTPFFQKSLFNHFEFSSPPFSLQQKLADTINDIDILEFCEGFPLEGPYCEVFEEVDRIADHLARSYSHLGKILAYQAAKLENPDLLEEEDPVTEETGASHESTSEGAVTAKSIAERIQAKFSQFMHSEEWKESGTLHELISALYRDFTRSSDFSSLYDDQSRSDIAVYCLLSLLLLARASKITEEPSSLTVSMSPLTEYYLRFHKPGEVELKPEDNPGIDAKEFFSMASDYPFHTSSPLTPNQNIGPSCFSSLVRDLKSLTDKEFFTLLEKWLELRSLDESMINVYIERVAKLFPPGKTLADDSLLSLTDLLDYYFSFVSDQPRVLESNKLYYFNLRGLGQFVRREEVPSFLHSEGNFASALCSFFVPISTTRHDGNCAVESILMELNGKDRYSGEGGKERLSQDIQEFRAGVVEHATTHREELIGKFGQEDVDDCIKKYNRLSQDEYTDAVALTCIAQKFGRQLRIYSRKGETFSTDEDGKIVPFEIFEPTDGPKGAPIHLAYWEKVHYCLLLPKSPKIE